MTHTRTRLLGAGLTAALTAGALLATPPAAHAAPVFTTVEVDPAVQSALSAGACTATTPPPGTPATVPLTENGPAVATNLTATRSYVANGDPADTLTTTATLAASSRATTAGGLPQSITTSFTGSFQSVAAKPGGSTCTANALAQIQVAFEFTLAQPMWLSWTQHHKGPAYTDVYIYDDNGDPYEDHYGLGWDSSSAGTIYLVPGTYRGYLESEISRTSSTSTSLPMSGSAALNFAPIGSASKAPSGKAGKYVALPGARSCATHNATATLTAKKKQVKQIEKVTFSVNGKKAATLKGKKVKKGKAVVLPLADNAAADITATVVLDNGKKKTVSAGYLACTS
ncbi:hypothetical protein [Nocardioides daeguensis]|uniref:Uncharacterized protein n=1 Tax=Nocardioides daeguensis TaxID=908359 RepID=A0ABP6VDU6_9ACTN|nr:hypothetical protein [Nocardioides daeguensis]MBV6726148.1 hypothetical protein [Nocardioides daeguensis]MCR1771991.1 hypothetical protein [Nocardioides daeguensis]